MTDKTAPVQPGKFSFDGYAFKIWLSKNKDAVKNDIRYILLALASLITIFQSQYQTEVWQYVLMGLAILVLNFVSKWGLDALDYFISENPQ